MSDDERDDAEFRLKDQAWSELVHVFEQLKASDNVSHESIAKRLEIPVRQVRRWLSAPNYMTVSIIGMLAAGMGARMTLRLDPISAPPLPNDEIGNRDAG